VWTRDAVDTRAPFHGLVIEIDRILLAEQRQRFRQTLAERQTEGGAHDRDRPAS
jgi:hypothetical protein